MLAIILVNYINYTDTVACINSILLQQTANFSIVIVDNSPDEGPFKELNGWLEMQCVTNSAFKNIYLVRQEINRGFGAANNYGLDFVKKHLDAEFIFLLNNDTLLHPDCLNNLMLALTDAKGMVLLAPKILTMGQPPLTWYAGGCFKPSKMSVQVFGLGEPDRVWANREVDFASGCALFFNRELIPTPIFDEQLFMYDEDVELCIRLSKLKIPILFINDAVVYHKCQGSQPSSGNLSTGINQLHPANPAVFFYLSNTLANRFYILKKHFTGWRKWYFGTSLTAYWMGKALQYLARGYPKLFLYTSKQTLLQYFKLC